ncbi:MAG: glycoside hydrolase family 5 protein [Pirellulaceae bacterium]
MTTFVGRKTLCGGCDCFRRPRMNTDGYRRVLVLLAGFLTILPVGHAVDAADSPPNLVRIKGKSFEDDNGPFLGLGVSYFQALRHAKYDRERLKSNLALFAAQGFNYVRILSMVSWDELEIAPVTFTNRAGRVVPAWPDYWEQFRSLLDLAAEHGLRVEVTIFADAQYVMPAQATRQSHLDGILTNIAGRESHILHLEVANEAWQNGFPDTQGVTDLREFTQHLADRTSVPVAITSNADTSDQGIISLYRGSAADLATVHFNRDTGSEEGGWLPVRDSYRAGNLPDVPPVSSNEPIGPGSSVSSESDPVKLCAAAVFAYLSNLPTYVYHSRAGVYGYVRCCPPVGGDERFENSAGIHAYQFLRQILPPDLASWVRNDGIEPSAPLTVFCNDQPNRYWPDVRRPTDGCDRNIGSVKGSEFVCFPMGILGRGVTLQARRAVRFQVFHPLTGEVVSHLTLNAGERFTLPQGPGAYICKGTFLSEDPPHPR